MLYVDSIDVTVADSWVVAQNKTGAGNGEAKLYVGYRNDARYRVFFGDEPFKLKAFFRKSEMQRHLKEMQQEYFNPTFNYRAKDTFRLLWAQRFAQVEALGSEINYF